MCEFDLVTSLRNWHVKVVLFFFCAEVAFSHLFTHTWYLPPILHLTQLHVHVQGKGCQASENSPGRYRGRDGCKDFSGWFSVELLVSVMGRALCFAPLLCDGTARLRKAWHGLVVTLASFPALFHGTGSDGKGGLVGG